MNAKKHGRRRFLKEGAALAGLAVGVTRSASGQAPAADTPEIHPKDTRAYGERSRFETMTRVASEGRSSEVTTPIQDTLGIITPSPLQFVTTHGNYHPDIDPRQHRLLIHGMVDRPLIFTLDELKGLPSVSRIHFLECGGNSAPTPTGGGRANTVQQTHGKTICSEWTGVPLSLLLKEAGVQKGAAWLLAEGAEPAKHAMSISLEKAMDDTLVVYGQNGEALLPDNGYPLRLLVPGWEGVRNIKWLRRIKVLDKPHMSKMESAGGYTSLRLDGKARWFYPEMGAKSVITRPAGGQRLPGRGFYEITGLAWSVGGVIRRVEVSTDGGRTWKDAQLQEPVHRIAHTRFRLGWNWDGEEAVLQSRCMDERGDVQPSLAELSKIWGVNLDYWLSTSNTFGHFNVIQPWKVTREGSVHNALWEL